MFPHYGKIKKTSNCLMIISDCSIKFKFLTNKESKKSIFKK